ncbi:cilia- and flagella-associated protein 299-like isoform X2 [Drosophila hydei]|uniref:Cilia- and flagella-associated protein 299 n=1 Tax=Drosophila hydei TaxID=7224 RepID=A0A6J1M259_DROHY|nr:cilia- and flagella-associated protein 299-like isoform X2 [Drosophila hydei]
MSHTIGDYRLLSFDTYQDYLKSNTKTDAYKYLRNAKVVNQVVKLGYHTNVTIYEENQFYEIKEKLLEQMNPVSHHGLLFSSFMKGNDPALCALASREERNMQKKLSVNKIATTAQWLRYIRLYRLRG